MTKINQDFVHYTGTDVSLVFPIADEAGISVDMTGACCEWLMQGQLDSGSLIKKQTSGSGIVVSGCTITVSLDASDTIGCPLAGNYYHELSASIAGTGADLLAIGTISMRRRGYG